MSLVVISLSVVFVCLLIIIIWLVAKYLLRRAQWSANLRFQLVRSLKSFVDHHDQFNQPLTLNTDGHEWLPAQSNYYLKIGHAHFVIYRHNCQKRTNFDFQKNTYWSQLSNNQVLEMNFEADLTKLTQAIKEFTIIAPNRYYLVLPYFDSETRSLTIGKLGEWEIVQWSMGDYFYLLQLAKLAIRQ